MKIHRGESLPHFNHEHDGSKGHHRHGDGHGGRGGHHEVRGGRARRGEAKYLLMDALRDTPKHGYEIIKSLEERSSGRYTPSPGMIYPTLQFLAEAGLIRAEQSSDRRIYHLTEIGKSELADHAEEVATFWSHFEPSPGSEPARAEAGFLQEELEYLQRAVWGGLRGTDANNTELIRRVRRAIEDCRNEVRRVITETITQEVERDEA